MLESGLSALSQCVSLSFLLAASALTDIKVPLNYDIPLDNSTTLTLRELQCPIVDGGQTGIYYNTTGISIEVFEPMNITCELKMEVNNTRHTTLIFGLTSLAGEALTIATDEDPARPCYSANATMAMCSLAPTISALRLSPPDSTLDFILSIIGGLLNAEIKKFICGLGEKITAQLTNTTVEPIRRFPQHKMGAMSVYDWPVTTMVGNIVNKLPSSIFGLHIDLNKPVPTGLELNVTLLNALNLSSPSSSNFSIYVPPNVLLTADVGFDMLVCRDSGWSCFVSNGIKLPNLRTTGGGQTDRLVSKVISPLLADFMDAAFRDGMPLNVPEDESHETPPMAMIMLFGPLLAMLAVACVAYSVFRHSKHPVLDIRGKAISMRRVIIEDVFVTGVCFLCIYLFAWSNATTAASVVVGDELTVYTFSLANSIEDMWKAGLYPLSILIAIFSGVYPYIKLIAIVTYSVILQQPQNRVLRLVDNFGKYSLLDSFVMTILKTGLEIDGIATVKSHFGFYVFVFATLGSMLIGNYATHGWRRQTEIRYNDNEIEQKVRQASATNRTTKGSSARTSPLPTVNNRLSVPAPQIGYGYSANEAHNTNGGGKNGSDSRESVRSTSLSPVYVYGGPMSGDDADFLASPRNMNLTSPLLSHTNDVEKEDDKTAGGTTTTTTQIVGASSPPKGRFDSAIRRHLKSDKGFEGIEANPSLRWYEVWEWELAVPLGALMAVISGVACYYPSITYYISGFATVLTGAEKPMSLWDLFLACDPILLIVGLFTVVFAPMIYVATYPHARFLAAWGATDVFLLSCVAGLLQLKQFIDFTLGDGMEGLYTASCRLQWPLGLWALSVFVQWFFTFKQTLGIPGLPTLTKIRLAIAIRESETKPNGFSPMSTG